MEKEQSEVAGEKYKKEMEKDQAQKYRAFLEQQMIKEAVDNSGIEEYRRIESEKIWVKRDNDKKAEDDARAQLLKEVKEGREEQVSWCESFRAFLFNNLINFAPTFSFPFSLYPSLLDPIEIGEEGRRQTVLP